MSNPKKTFALWCAEQIGSSAVSELSLDTAFCLAVCRIEEAVRMGAKNPISVVGNAGAAASSRRATRSMLRQVGYSEAQSRVVQRLLAGFPGGWPGLIRLYLKGDLLTKQEREYATRQVRLFRSAARDLTASAALAGA